MKVLSYALPEELENHRSFLQQHLHRTVALFPESVGLVNATYPDDIDPFGSRIGGPAITTEDFPWPTDQTGSQLLHVAQINLGDLPTHPSHPDAGLLQIFMPRIDRNNVHNEPGFRGTDAVVRTIPSSEFPYAVLEGSLENQTNALHSGFFELELECFNQFPALHSNDFDSLQQLYGIAFSIEEQTAFTDLLEDTPQTFLEPDALQLFGSDRASDDDQLLLQVHSIPEHESEFGVELSWGKSEVLQFFLPATNSSSPDLEGAYYRFKQAD
ncbi:MAG: DUF1963 domain-containing protein [Corynebacterium sp.]|nr:DUF1963 domain-containing protein [Corynebacterium sp.]